MGYHNIVTIITYFASIVNCLGLSFLDIEKPLRSFDSSAADFYINEVYVITSPALTSTPPIMSVIQCTPDASLPMIIKAINPAIAIITHLLNTLFLIRT